MYGRGGPYRMGLHATSSTLHTKQSAHSPVAVNIEWDQAWRSPPAHSHSLGAPIPCLLPWYWFLPGEEALGRLVWVWRLLDRIIIKIPLIRWIDSNSWAVFSNYPYSLVWFHVIPSHEMSSMIHTKLYFFKDKLLDHGPGQGVSQLLCPAIWRGSLWRYLWRMGQKSQMMPAFQALPALHGGCCFEEHI